MDTSKSTHTLNDIEGTTGTHRNNLEAKMRKFEVIENEKKLINESDNVEFMPPPDGGSLDVQQTFELAYKEADWDDVIILGYEKGTGHLLCYTSHMQNQALLWILESMKHRLMKSAGK